MELAKILAHTRTIPVCYYIEGILNEVFVFLLEPSSETVALCLNSDRGFIFSYLLCLNIKCKNISALDHTFVNSSIKNCKGL